MSAWSARVCTIPVQLTGPELCETVRVDLADGGKRVWREREHVGRQSGVHLVPNARHQRPVCASLCACESRASGESTVDRAGRCLRVRGLAARNEPRRKAEAEAGVRVTPSLLLYWF